MNIDNSNSIQASTYTIDPAAIQDTEEYAKRQGESRTEGSSSGKPVSDSIRISDDARQERDKKIIEELEKIDRQVQQHEAAHQAAAGELFRGKSFSYKIGPDGKRYAVSGEVHIDTSAAALNPKATIAKMERIRRAATAPADPSPQDMSVAADAAKVEAEAKQQLMQESLAASNNKSENLPDPAAKIVSQEDKLLTQAEEKVSSVMKSLRESKPGKDAALAPNMQVSILFSTPSNTLGSPKPRVDLVL